MHHLILTPAAEAEINRRVHQLLCARGAYRVSLIAMDRIRLMAELVAETCAGEGSSEFGKLECVVGELQRRGFGEIGWVGYGKGWKIENPPIASH